MVSVRIDGMARPEEVDVVATDIITASVGIA